MMKWIAAIAVALMFGMPALADVRSTAAREAAEYILRKFGKEAGQETVETLGRKLEQLAVKHGDDVLVAAKQVGPRALTVAAAAGDQSTLAYRLMAKYGDNAVAMIITKPGAMKLVSSLGDDAAKMLIQHPGIAEPLLQQGGKAAVQALEAVGPQGGRRLAMLLEDGTLTAAKQSPELLGVVSKYGEKGLNFIWNNKGKLAVAGTLAAFIANPQPFIDGTLHLADIAGETVVKPLATAAAKSIPWGYIAAGAVGILAFFLGVRRWQDRARIPAA